MIVHTPVSRAAWKAFADLYGRSDLDRVIVRQQHAGEWCVESKSLEDGHKVQAIADRAESLTHRLQLKRQRSIQWKEHHAARVADL